jgi:hypothetical protein
MGFSLNPITLHRKFWEFLGDTPKRQYTLGSLFTDNMLVTWRLSRGARMAERAWTIGFGAAAVLAALPALPWAGPLGVAAALVVPLINIKLEGMALGFMVHFGTRLGRFVAQTLDLGFNGPDELRPQKLPKMDKSLKPQRQPAPKSEQSPLDRVIEIGKMFNGQAGQQNPLKGASIWGDATPQQQQQSTTNTYEQAFTVPTPEQIRLASSGGESVAMHDLKLHNPPPTHHEPPPPPAPVYKPPGCDN